ncbi:MAG: class II aldolase/adducin family protein [Firmicutes bacterium]|nr:class II aldolase/adducin family protein [Bacillota bacterium]
MQFTAQRRQVVEYGRQMARAALAVGTWGNISCRLPGNLMAITPSGMEYEALEPKDIVIMDLEGNCLEGECKPSTEQPLHRAIYAARDDVGAIVHTHSVYASAMAAARKPIPAAVEDLVQIVGGDVRVAAYALPGSSQLGSNAVAALAGRNGALLANHGVVGVGTELGQALLICQIIEKSAQIYIAAQAIGGVVELPQEDIDIMRDFFLHKYGQR